MHALMHAARALVRGSLQQASCAHQRSATGCSRASDRRCCCAALHSCVLPPVSGARLLACWQVVDGADLTKHLSDTAISFAAGKEPWRRFAVPAKLLAKHKAAAAAAAEAGGAGPSAPAPAAAAAAAGSGGGDAEELPWAFCAAAVAADVDGPRLYVAEQPYPDEDAAQADAIRKGMNSFWRHYRLVSAAAAAFESVRAFESVTRRRQQGLLRVLPQRAPCACRCC